MLDAVKDGLIDAERETVTVTLWLKLPVDVADNESVRVGRGESLTTVLTDGLFEADRE